MNRLSYWFQWVRPQHIAALAMQITSGGTCASASTAVAFGAHLVPRYGHAKQQRHHLSRWRGYGEQHVSGQSDNGCALRNTYTCSASQRDGQATVVSGM